MRKDLLFVLLLVFSIISFDACNKPKGELSWAIVPSDTVLIVAPNDQLSWKINISPDPVEKSTIGEIKATATINNGEEKEIYLNKPNSYDPLSVTVSYSVPSDLPEGTLIHIKITATDGLSGNSIEFTPILTLKDKIYQSYENKTLQWNPYDYDNYKMLLLMDRTSANAFDGNNPDAQLAFVYSSDTAYLFVMASPNAEFISETYQGSPSYITGDKQYTVLTKTDVLWDQIDENYIINNFINKLDTTYIHDSTALGVGVNQLKIGDVIAFQNNTSGTVGALIIRNLTASKGVYSATFDLKYLIYPNGLPSAK